jgi:predicted Holliday junction resolvase-like endonuclease
MLGTLVVLAILGIYYMLFGKTLVAHVKEYYAKIKEKERRKEEAERQKLEAAMEEHRETLRKLEQQQLASREAARKRKEAAEKKVSDAADEVKRSVNKLKADIDEKLKTKFSEFNTEINPNEQKVLTILCNKTVISVYIKTYYENTFSIQQFELFTKTGKKIEVSEKLKAAIFTSINNNTYTVAADLNDFL